MPFYTAKNLIPSPLNIEAAMRCRIYTEDGRNVDFASVIQENYGAPTIAIFVRHMWCGLCQEFLCSLQRVDERCYTSVGVEVIVVGCGEPALIRKYKGMLRLLFPPLLSLIARTLPLAEHAKFDGRMYSDPSGELQERLGMTLRTLNPGTEAEKGYACTAGLDARFGC